MSDRRPLTYMDGCRHPIFSVGLNFELKTYISYVHKCFLQLTQENVCLRVLYSPGLNSYA